MALVVLAYWGIWSFELTNFDDQVYVVGNPHVRGFDAENVRWALVSFERAIWAPAVWLSFMLDFELWGDDPSGYHLQNLAWHGAAVVLLFLALFAMTEALLRSALVAAVFAVHPVHVESVAWVTERKDVLSAFFFILAIWAYIRHCHRPSATRSLGVAGAMVLGLASKPSVVTLPLVLLLLDCWPLGRLRSRAQLGPRLLEKLPLFALSLASSTITIAAARETVIPLQGLELWARLSNALVSYARYLRMFAWPVDLAAYYPHPGAAGWPAVPTLLAALLIAALTAAAIRARATHPYLLVGWLWYLAVLVPMIGVVQFAGHALADRFLHLPSIGLSIALVWGVGALAKRRVRPGVLGASAAAWILALTLSTRLQVRYWRDSVTLFERVIATGNASYLPHYNLAHALATVGRLEEAVEHYEAARRFHATSAAVHSDLGLCYARLGRSEEARAALERALALDPAHAPAHLNLGILAASTGDPDDAARHFRRALELDPGIAYGHFNLALAHHRAGRHHEAERVLEDAMQRGGREERDARLLEAVRRAIAEGERRGAPADSVPLERQ